MLGHKVISTRNLLLTGIVGFISAVILFRPTFFDHQLIYERPTSIPNYVKQHLAHGVTAPIQGIDVSHYQGNIDWQQVEQANIKFTYLKATDGITYQDPAFARNVKALTKTNILVGPYHFFEADDAAEKQLANFLTTIKGQSLSLAPMIDVELKDGRSPAQIKHNLKIFLEQLTSAIGCQPIIYSYGSFFQNDIGSEFNEYPFWLAEYSTEPNLPASVKNWHMWQYSDSGHVPGIKTQVDLDVFLAGQQQFDSMRCHYKT